LKLAGELSPADWMYLFVAWWILIWYAMSLKWRSFDYLSLPVPSEPPDSRVLPFAHRLHRLVELASRLHFMSMNCLPRSLALRRLLAWRGIPSFLCIGVARTQSGMQAHAWVDVAGAAVGEADDVAEKFIILDHVPTHPSYKFSP